MTSFLVESIGGTRPPKKKRHGDEITGEVNVVSGEGRTVAEVEMCS